jgi:hypothetical protein
MKFFTPERYLRLGNLDGEEAFLTAQEAWEQALAGYREQLRRVRKSLPRGLRALVESVYLHDARVLAMHQTEKDFFITLQPPSDPERLAVLAYSLVEAPAIKRDVLPPERRREPVEWLYDELDLDPPQRRRAPPPAGKPPVRHNILLSNGWEVVLRFRSARVMRPLRVIPAASAPGARPAVGSRSA